MIRVLFVCMGNVCRSPMAQGIMQKLLEQHDLDDQVLVDSAGTHAYHLGRSPDPRAILAAQARGIDIRHLRARQAEPRDLKEFDLVLVMDEQNYDTLSFICTDPTQREKIGYLLDYAPHFATRTVPDPYYGGDMGFEKVMDMLEDACLGLLRHLQDRYLRRVL